MHRRASVIALLLCMTATTTHSCPSRPAPPQVFRDITSHLDRTARDKLKVAHGAGQMCYYQVSHVLLPG